MLSQTSFKVGVSKYIEFIILAGKVSLNIPRDKKYLKDWSPLKYTNFFLVYYPALFFNI